MSEQELSHTVGALARPLADECRLELVDVEVKGPRNRRLVRLVVASPTPAEDRADTDGGLDVDRIADLSCQLGDALEADDVIAGGYTLEVTSPGVDRPLSSPRDFERNLGRDIRLVRAPATDDAHPPGEITGTLAEVGSASLTLRIDDEPLEVSLAEIDHGKVVLPW